MGLTPTFLLYMGDKKTLLDEKLTNSITSLAVKDNARNEVDELTIEIVGDYNQTPKNKDLLGINTTIEVWLGYKETGCYNCGSYAINAIEQKKGKTRISATSCDFTLSLKEKRNRSFKDISIKKIVETIAKFHNLKVKCDLTQNIKYFSQTNESDLNLLKRLSETYNALFSIKYKTILFLEKEETLPVFEIFESECIDWSFNINHVESYQSVKASWRDTKRGLHKNIQIGDQEPTLIINGQFASEDEARSTALSRLLSANGNNITGNISIVGQNIIAGSIIILHGFGYYDQNVFIAESVDHQLDVNGYILTIDLKLNVDKDDLNSEKITIEAKKAKRKKRVDTLRKRKVARIL
jgi:hypothetical protein